MTKGIVLGLLFQVVSAVGFLFIASATTVKSDLFKTMLVLCFSGIAAFAVVSYFMLSGREQLSSIGSQNLLYLLAGALLIFVIGEFLFIAGLSASNLTTISYTALAFPAVALILELILGRVKVETLTLRDFLGFGLLITGFLVLMSRK